MTQPRPAPLSTTYQPLAAHLRPHNLGEAIGQQHLLGEGMPGARLAHRLARAHHG